MIWNVIDFSMFFWTYYTVVIALIVSLVSCKYSRITRHIIVENEFTYNQLNSYYSRKLPTEHVAFFSLDFVHFPKVFVSENLSRTQIILNDLATNVYRESKRNDGPKSIVRQFCTTN